MRLVSRYPWLNRLFQPSRRGAAKRRRLGSRSRPVVEALEKRCAPAIFNPPPDADAASLRDAIAQADSNSDASNTIMLAAGEYPLSDPMNGHIVIQNTSSLPDKTLLIVGQGQDQTLIDSPGTNAWHDRIFEIAANAGSVSFQSLTIEKGTAVDGGMLGGTDALGGGLLIEGGQVSLSQVTVTGNYALASNGVTGADGNGAAGGNAYGGGIYVADGTLTITNTMVTTNGAYGGYGGNGGGGGSGGGSLGGAGGIGGRGGSGGGGSNGTFDNQGNQAAGGNGGDAGLTSDSADGGKSGDAGKGGGGGLFIQGAMATFDLTPTGNMVLAGAADPGGLGGVSVTAGIGGEGGFGGTAGPGGLAGNGGADGVDGMTGADGNPGMPGNPGQAGANGGLGMNGIAADPDIYMGGGGGAAAPGPHSLSVPRPITAGDASALAAIVHVGGNPIGSSQPPPSSNLPQCGEAPKSLRPASVKENADFRTDDLPVAVGVHDDLLLPATVLLAPLTKSLRRFEPKRA
jgi:hypothetical protein